MIPLSWYVLVNLLPYIATIILSLAIAVYIWKRRARVHVARPFLLVIISEALWTTGYICELLGVEAETKIFWDNMQWVASFGVPLGLFWFATCYTSQSGAWVTAAWRGLIVSALIGIILVFTDPLHHWLRPTFRIISGAPFDALVYDWTLLFWLMFGTMYVVTLVSLGVLVRQALQMQRLYRAQISAVIAGIVLPMIIVLLSTLGVVPTFQRDTSPFALALSNVIIAWGLVRYSLFNVAPIAWRAIVEQMRDAVMVLDVQNQIVDLNPSAKRMLDRPAEELIGQPTVQAFDRWPELIEQYNHQREVQAELMFESEQGRSYIEMDIAPLCDSHQRYVGRVIIFRDITERKTTEQQLQRYRHQLEELVAERTADLEQINEQLRVEISERARLEEQFRQVQKIEAIGQLAGGVAHDFNNLLVPIIGYAQLGLLNLQPADDLYADLQQILLAAERASNLTQQILAFSRQQVLDMHVLDLNTIISGFHGMMQRLIAENIVIRASLAPDLNRVWADKTQIEQVLLNLVVNARDAMPNGGTLLLETSNVVLDEAYVATAPDMPQPGHYAMIAVSDTGLGMDPATRQHIFEPFYTTKERGKGTGLGLSTVFGIVRQHGGSIWVYSEPGCGTTFKVYLPCTDDTEAHVPVVVESGNTYGVETVLIVEDEVLVRQLICEALERYGYRVLAAQSPADALQIAAACATPIDLLLSDVVMPGMAGHELYTQLIERHPTIKVLYMSGYTDDAIVHHGILNPTQQFLQKPFTLQRLTQRVRTVLDQATTLLSPDQ